MNDGFSVCCLKSGELQFLNLLSLYKVAVFHTSGHYILSVKLYDWKHSGDDGPYILSSRAACWPALIYRTDRRETDTEAVNFLKYFSRHAK